MIVREYSPRGLGVLVIIFFWALCLWGDYPAPFIDDLSYIGTGIGMAKYGLYSNPYTEMFRFLGSGPGHLYLNYVPLESYVLAGWLKLFGITTLSFRALFLLLSLMCSLFIFRFMPKRDFAWIAALVICLLVFGLLGGVGVRPDALGLFFLLLGFDTWRSRTPLGFFARNTSLALALIAFLNIAPSSFCLSIFGLLHLRIIQKKSIREMIPFFVALAAAYGLSFILFLACIHGQLLGFLDSVFRNSHMGSSGVRERFQFFTSLGMAKWVVAQGAFLAVVLLKLWQAKSDPAQREQRLFLGFSLVLFACLFYASFSSATGAHLWGFACLVALLYLGMQGNWRWPAWTAYGLACVMAAYGHGHVAIQHLLASPMPPQSQFQAIREKVASMKPERLYLDEYAIRELYGYDLPDNARDYQFSSTQGLGTPQNEAQLPKNAVFVVSVGSALPTTRNPDGGKAPKPLRIFGISIPRVSQNPYELEIMDTRN